MERLAPSARRDPYGSRVGRRHSALVASVVPWLSIALGSVLPIFVIATAMPIAPPVGFIMFVCWRLVRPGLLPAWAGVPLGVFDDLFNGQPFGFAILFWSLAVLAIDAVEARFPWRSFGLDWITAALLILLYIFAGMVVSGAVLAGPLFVAVIPQLVLSVLLVPVAARLVAALDRLRLRRWRRAG